MIQNNQLSFRQISFDKFDFSQFSFSQFSFSKFNFSTFCFSNISFSKLCFSKLSYGKFSFSEFSLSDLCSRICCFRILVLGYLQLEARATLGGVDWGEPEGATFWTLHLNKHSKNTYEQSSIRQCTATEAFDCCILNALFQGLPWTMLSRMLRE